MRAKALSLFIATEKCTQGTTRNSMLCRKEIEKRSWQNANVKASRRVLRRKQVVKSRLPRLLEKELAATKRKLKKTNRKISSLQTKCDSGSNSSTSAGDEPSNNGGNSFGGREKKKKGKKSKKN